VSVDDDRSVQGALQDLVESQGISALCFDSAERSWILERGTRRHA